MAPEESNPLSDRLGDQGAGGQKDIGLERLAGRILPRLPGDSQAVRDWLRAGELNELSALEAASKSRSSARQVVAGGPPTQNLQREQVFRSGQSVALDAEGHRLHQLADRDREYVLGPSHLMPG
jgi:hypothetical protein